MLCYTAMQSSRKVVAAFLLLVAIGVLLVADGPLFLEFSRHGAAALNWGTKDKQEKQGEEEKQEEQEEVDPAYEALKREVAVNVTGKLDPQKVIFSSFRKYGLGSEVINTFAQKIMMNDYGFNYVIDDWHGSAYNWGGDMKSLFTGVWNATTFRAMNATAFVKEYGNPVLLFASKKKKYKSFEEVNAGVFRVNWDTDFREAFFKKYGRFGEKPYGRMALEACANLQFTKHAKEVLHRLKSNVPDLRKSHSVAFHVRRGDKLGGKKGGEAKLHSGKDYVHKLLDVLNRTGVRDHLDDCFVASDDYRAVLEVEEALKQQNVTCDVYTLTNSTEYGYDQNKLNRKKVDAKRHQEQQFMAELSLMVDATYFVGAFESNVAGLVGIMRKCVHMSAPHYGHSYGIDSDEWYFRK